MDNKLIKIFEKIVYNKNNYINNFKENIKMKIKFKCFTL